MVTIDGNEAAAYVAHMTNEVIAIYPITPASPMGEWADEWSSLDVKNLWGTVPDVIEMQSEAGAAGAIHGALQAGSLATTFTASQGLLLMIPNMYKIAGELSPTVLHVSARSLAAQALSIFGDHSDVMACRATGYAMLCSASVQEVMDFALIAQAATLEGRIPFLHFFDGFRTSHEVDKVEKLPVETIRAMIDEGLVKAHRDRALNPDHPVIRGTSQNPDVYFQGRESVNPYYHALPAIVEKTMDRFGELTGRRYGLFEYVGAEDAERVIMLMGSGIGAAEESVEHLAARGERVGLIKVRLFRPFDPSYLLGALPVTTRKIAVLDRCKEPGADGEPLYKDVLTALAQSVAEGNMSTMPRVVGGRYGLSSKEFTPAMVKGIFDELAKDKPRNQFSVGIIDDVTGSSLEWDPGFRPDAAQGVTACVFYGLGSDGTVSANKNSIKIIAEETPNYGQGYFQYDSKKAGAVTISHLRFGPNPIESTYLVGNGEASFVACHQPTFLTRYDMLDKARYGAVFLLNAPTPPDKVWDDLPGRMQQQIIEKGISFYVIDAYRIAGETGMGRRINTIMQTCFFAISGILPKEEAIAQIKQAVKKTYGRKGQRLLDRNYAAIDAALDGLHQVQVPGKVSSTFERPPVVPADAPEFVQKVTAVLMADKGDSLPVSLMPADGTWPTGTTRFEKRNIALELPKWEDDICTHCGKCPLVCPHAAIRAKVYPAGLTADAPETFQHVQIKGKDFPEGYHITYQVAPDDCTGCGLCVEVCPIRDRKDPKRKALNMHPAEERHELERANWDFFLELPEYDRTRLEPSKIKHAMMLQPLFEFSGACVGCGETPYIKLATQLFGRLLLHLRRQPANYPLHGQSGRARSELEQLPVRGQCGVWPGPEAGGGQADRARPRAGEAARRQDRRRAGRGAAGRRPTRGGRDLRATGADRRPKAQARQHEGSAGRDSGGHLREPGQTQCLDHRRRRLGLRHRLRGRRSCARLRAQRQPAGARHRGLLQHGRPNLQGHAAGRGGQVLRRRQTHLQEGPGHDGHGLRERLRRPGRLRRQGRADHPRLPGGRVLRRSLADHLLLALHRPRCGPVQQPAPAGHGGQLRPLGTVPLRPAQDVPGGEPAAHRLQGTEYPLSGLCLHRDPVQRADPYPPGSGGALS